jgi:hypothetical protein
MKNEYAAVAVILILIHLAAGYIGALIANVFVRRSGRGLPALHVFACGMAGALAAIALVLAAVPFMLGLIVAPVAGGLAVVLWSNSRKG